MSTQSESEIVLALIEKAVDAMPDKVAAASENDRITYLFDDVDARINDLCPGGGGGVGFAQRRRARELRRLVWPVLLQREADYREDMHAGYESRGEMRAHL